MTHHSSPLAPFARIRETSGPISRLLSARFLSLDRDIRAAMIGRLMIDEMLFRIEIVVQAGRNRREVL
jgi:hypothetical protein